MVLRLRSSQIDIDFFKTLSLINLFTNAPPPIAIIHSFLLRHYNTSFSSSNLKKFSPFFSKIS